MLGVDTIVGITSLAIAIPGLVRTFIYASYWLSDKLRTAPRSPEVTEIQTFLLFLDRGMMKSTLEMVEDLYVDTSDVALRSYLEAAVRQLWAKIVKLDANIDTVKSTIKGRKESKKATDAALSIIKDTHDLESRLREYVHSEIASTTLRSRFDFRRAQFCLVGTVSKVLHSRVSVARGDFNLHDRRGTENCIIEEKTFPGISAGEAYEQAVDLSRTLQFFDASDSLLTFIGFQVLNTSPTTDSRFRYVFSFPEDRDGPRSLRDILSDPINKPIPPIPRNYRFALPRKLAEAVYHVHKQNLVHKCIRPESVLLFKPAGDSPELQYPKTIGTPYLVDWAYARKTVEVSMRQGHGDWIVAMYQHPERQAPPGSVSESAYNIGHDIYSLGICLLELGLWDSFIVGEEGAQRVSPMLSDAKAEWRRENVAVSQSTSEARVEQQAFIKLAEMRLAYEMGEAYSKLVVKCLTCMERGFGNVSTFVDSTSRDWDEQGDLFIQEVRRELALASTMGIGIYNRVL